MMHGNMNIKFVLVRLQVIPVSFFIYFKWIITSFVLAVGFVAAVISGLPSDYVK